MMEFCKLAIKSALCILLLTGCKPSEPELDFSFEQQEIGQPFSFAEYCDEAYDSLYVIYPYDDEDYVWSLPYKMSRALREECSYTLNDTYSTILFISDGVVRAYSKITYDKAVVSPPTMPENMHLFPFGQLFVFLDKEDKRAALFGGN